MPAPPDNLRRRNSSPEEAVNEDDDAPTSTIAVSPPSTPPSSRAGPSRPSGPPRPPSQTSSTSTPTRERRIRDREREGERTGTKSASRRELNAASPRRRVARERTVYVKQSPVALRSAAEHGSASARRRSAAPSTADLEAEEEEAGADGGRWDRTIQHSPAQRERYPSRPTSAGRAKPDTLVHIRSDLPSPLIRGLSISLALLRTLVSLLLILLGPVLPYLLAIPLLLLFFSALLHFARAYALRLAWWTAQRLIPGLSSMHAVMRLAHLPGLGRLAALGLERLEETRRWLLLAVNGEGGANRLGMGITYVTANGTKGAAGATVVQVLDAPLKAGATIACALTGMGCSLSYYTRLVYIPPAPPSRRTTDSLGDFDSDRSSRSDGQTDSEFYDGTEAYSSVSEPQPPLQSNPQLPTHSQQLQVETVLAQPFWRWSAQRQRERHLETAALARRGTLSVKGATSVLDSLELLGPGGLENIQYDKIWELSSTVRSGSNLESRDYFASELWKLGDTARDLSDELQHFNAHANAQFAWLVESFNRLTTDFLLPPSQRPPVPALSASLHSTVLLLSRSLDALSLEADSLASLALEGSVSGSLLRTQLDETLHSLSAVAAREAGIKRISHEVAHFFVGGEPSRASLIRRDIEVTKGVIEGLGGLVRRIEEWRGVCTAVRDGLGRWEGGMMGYHLAQDGGGGEEEVRRETELLRGWVGELASSVGVRRGVGSGSRRMRARDGERTYIDGRDDRGQRRVERIDGGEVRAIEA